MSLDIHHLSDTELRTEQAFRAVRVFRGMQPGLSGYAQALTGDKSVRVVVATGTPRTDGKKIYYRPPIALGDLTPHDRNVCDKRNENKRLLCPACATREDVLVDILHEIGHIAFGTFTEVADQDKRTMLQKTIDEHGSKYAEKIKKGFERLPPIHSYQQMAGVISQFLPFIVNCLEDARVDQQMFNARKGTKKMFNANIQKIFTQGVEQNDGSIKLWKDYELNTQMIVALYTLSCGYDYAGWFDSKVEEALDDPELDRLIDQVQYTRTVRGIYHLAFPVLARLRELGFCKLPEDPEDEEQPAPPPVEGEASPDGSGEGTDSDPESEEDSEDASGDTSSDVGGDEEDSPSPDSDSMDSGNEDEAKDDGGEATDSSGEEGAGGVGGVDSPDEESQDRREVEDAERDSDSGDESETQEGQGQEEDSEVDDSEGRSEDSEVSEESSDLPDGDSEHVNQDTDGEGESPSDEVSRETSPGDSDVDSDSNLENSEQRNEADLEDQSRQLQENVESTGTEDSPTGNSDTASELVGVQPSDAEDGLEGERDADDQSIDRRDRELAVNSETDETEADPVDTGAADGTGGVEIQENYGDTTELNDVIAVIHPHGEIHILESNEDSMEEQHAVDVAVIQGLYFETPSMTIGGVHEHRYDKHYLDETGKDFTEAIGWTEPDVWSDPMQEFKDQRSGKNCDMDVPESILGSVLLKMRRVFVDNQRSKYDRNRKSGRVNTRVLGRRAWQNDDRLFQKKYVPGRRSYAVLIGIDVSGSTVGLNIALAKRAAMAKAELCYRTGVDFAVYAHSGTGWGRGNTVLDILEIKSFDDPWDDKTKEAFRNLGSVSQNLDGHSIEYYRKKLERHPADRQVLLYYSDGKMPAANFDEELTILQREIRTCRKKNIVLACVGIRTDSPREHGLPTVEVWQDEDLIKVVEFLEKMLID